MIKKIAGGESHVLVIDDVGKLYATGAVQQLGLGHIEPSYRFEEVKKLPPGKILAVAAGYASSYVLFEDKSLWVTGNNYSSMLGLDSTQPNFYEFVEVTTLPPDRVITAIAASDYNHMVLLDDGTVWVSGMNCSGQLGLGHKNVCSRFTPVTTLPKDKRVTHIATGQYSCFVQLEDHSIWAAGQNQYHQLGLDEPRDYEHFTQLTKLPAASQPITIFAGQRHTLFLVNGHTLWGVGDNKSNQLGLPTADTRALSPLSKKGLPPDKTIIKAFAGWQASYVILNDGTLWAIGDNSDFQFGMNNNKNYSEFTQINTLPKEKSVLDIVAVYRSSIVLLNDGHMWVTGNNIFGQLGMGNRTAYRIFTENVSFPG